MTLNHVFRYSASKCITTNQLRAIHTTRTTFAKSEVGQMISDVAQQEGGMAKDSKAAQLQSEVTKQLNARQSGQQSNQQSEQSIGSKIANNPSSVTADDAQQLHSATSRSRGGQQPPSGSIASQAQSLAAKNERGAPIAGQTNPDQADPTLQSQLDRQKNYDDAAEVVKQKMEHDPAAVTKEDGDTMHSREQKAFGTTEKGGLASQAQKQASRNEQ